MKSIYLFLATILAAILSARYVANKTALYEQYPELIDPEVR